MQVDPAAGFQREVGRPVDRFELAVDQDRQGQLETQIIGFAGGAAAVGLAATAAALDKTAGEHIAEGTKGTDQTAAEFQFTVRGHAFYLHKLH